MGASICESTIPIVKSQAKSEEIVIDNYSYDMSADTKIDSKTLQTISKTSTPRKGPSSLYMDIEKIISVNKLHTKNNNEVLFISSLELLSDCDSLYHPLFCVLTRLYFISYEKRTDFLSMKKPMSKLPLETVESVQAVQCKAKWHLCISLRSKAFKLKFQAMNEELIFKWVVVINYFIGIANRKSSHCDEKIQDEVKALFLNE